MKPSWSDAPEWANWLAKNANGDWKWHECEPEKKWALGNKSGYVGKWEADTGRSQIASRDYIDWEQSLEKRTETE